MSDRVRDAGSLSLNFSGSVAAAVAVVAASCENGQHS